MPFYSVLPDTERYPAFAHGGPLPVAVDDDGPRTASMSAARIRDDLPELMRGAELLMERRWSFEDALADYFPRLLKAYGGDRSKIFTLDGIHRAYLSGRTRPRAARTSRAPRAAGCGRGRGARRSAHPGIRSASMRPFSTGTIGVLRTVDHERACGDPLDGAAGPVERVAGLSVRLDRRVGGRTLEPGGEDLVEAFGVPARPSPPRRCTASCAWRTPRTKGGAPR